MTANDLTRRQLKFVAALMESTTVAEAAHRAGIGEKTTHRYLKEPAVQNAIRAAGREQLESLTRRLRRLGQDAAETLGAAMQAEDASWSPRIKAADSVIGRLLKVSELLDLEERVTALGQAMRKERP
jgi:phage terminase small subunit